MVLPLSAQMYRVIAEAYHYEDDIDNIPLATIEARFKR